MKKNIIAIVLIPLLFLIGATLVFRYSDLDVAISELFYSPEAGFFLKDASAWMFVYHHGNIPSLLLAFGGLLLFVFSFFSYKILPYRKIGLFLVVFLIVGPGLIVNTAFKGHWGRPRPREIVQFGGEQQFLPVWEKGKPGEGKSFPSGHASVGFFLFAPFFFLWTHGKKGWATFFLILGISYGTFMGIGRIAQGGHFASDVVWAGGFVYCTGLVLHYMFRLDKGISRR